MSLMFPREAPVSFAVSTTGRPVVRSMRRAHVTAANGSATSTSPVVRSSVYANPFLSKCTSTWRRRPWTSKSARIISAFAS